MNIGTKRNKVAHKNNLLFGFIDEIILGVLPRRHIAPDKAPDILLGEYFYHFCHHKNILG